MTNDAGHERGSVAIKKKQWVWQFMLVISALGGGGKQEIVASLRLAWCTIQASVLILPSPHKPTKKNPPKNQNNKKTQKTNKKTPPNQKKPQTNKKKAKIKYQIEHLKPQNIFTSQRRNQFV